MRHFIPVFVFFALAGAAGAARAEEPPPPVPTPPPNFVPDSPSTQPVPPPTMEERRRVVEMAPGSAAPVAPPYVVTAPPPAYYPSSSACCTPPPCGCFLTRDCANCEVDACGNRYGRWIVSLEGSFSNLGSPDGILGERSLLPDDQLNWDDVDYDGVPGGRIGISYAYDCTDCRPRIELRGTYYGNPDGDDRATGHFAAGPGDDGLGDESRLVSTRFASEVEAWGAELNWWTEIDCTGHWRYDIGFGLRYFHLEETALTSFTTLDAGGPFPVDNGFVKSSVDIDFLGAQIMGAAHADFTQCFGMYGQVKLMFGAMQTDTRVTDLDMFAGNLHSSSISDDEFVFGLDFELGLRWRIAKWIGVSGGYNMFFLDNVQHAEDAMDFSVSNSGAVQVRQNADQLVIHSLFLGVWFQF